jgi:hypothetical protein
MPDRTGTTAARCPGAPSELVVLIDEMLALDPALRPASDEVRNRARYLADTLEQLRFQNPRWTPPRGLPPDAVPATEDAGFSVRIGRTRTV